MIRNVAHVSPTRRGAEHFSPYEVSIRGAAFRVRWSVLDATGSFRIGALALAVFFVAGFGILARVDLPRGAAAAGNKAPPKLGSSYSLS